MKRNNHLSEEDVALWIEALENNRISTLPGGLKDHVSRCRKCRDLVVEHSAILLQDETMKPFPGLITKTVPLRSRNRLLMAAAAIVVLLILPCAGIFLFMNRQENAGTELYAKYFAPYPDMITVKSLAVAPGSSAEDLADGMNFYSMGNYDSAVYHFNICLKHDAAQDTVAFYKGIALLASGENPAGAIAVFNALIQKKSPFSLRSEWYLALAYLKEGKPKEAGIHLRNIPATDRELSAKASALLAELW